MPACREFLRHCRFDGQCLRRNSEHQGIRPMPNLVTAVLAGRFLRWRIPYPTHQTDNISSRILTARICWYESSAQAEKAVAPKTVARINCLNFMMLPSFAQSVRNSEARSLWLCGSRSFTSGIAGNLKTRSLHQELFEFRQMNLTRKL